MPLSEVHVRAWNYKTIFQNINLSFLGWICPSETSKSFSWKLRSEPISRLGRLNPFHTLLWTSVWYHINLWVSPDSSIESYFTHFSKFHDTSHNFRGPLSQQNGKLHFTVTAKITHWTKRNLTGRREKKNTTIVKITPRATKLSKCRQKPHRNYEKKG